jgi:type II secretory pathway component PulC
VVEAPAAEVPEPALGLRMVGYLDDGTKPRAILSVDSTGVEAIVREGDAFEGFEVRQITRDAVVVINRGEEITVKLFDQ